MDSSQFTSELVQFTSVEQQISTNSNLTQLIQLTQASQIEQSASMLGKPVTVTSPQLTLQNGSRGDQFQHRDARNQWRSRSTTAAGARLQTATLKSTGRGEQLDLGRQERDRGDNAGWRLQSHGHRGWCERRDIARCRSP